MRATDVTDDTSPKTTRVTVNERVLEWAVDRSGMEEASLERRIPALRHWRAGDRQPTVRQLEAFAKATHTPLGFLFLAHPPVERLPIPYYRTAGPARTLRPSAGLVETVLHMQQRQAWMREYLSDVGWRPLPFVGSAAGKSTSAVAKDIRDRIGLPTGWASKLPTWTDALARLRTLVENSGILIVSNGVVGNNTNWKLDPSEFRGFVLVDEIAPLVFVNSADARAAQMFTLAHELAHVWLGSSAAFDLRRLSASADATEQTCDRIAAELLVSEREIRAEWPNSARQPVEERVRAMARHFKVSELVIARRARDLTLMTPDQFAEFYTNYMTHERTHRASGGGDFYANQNNRVGQRFARTVMQAVREGKLLYTEAYRLTDLRGRAFEEYLSRLV